MLTLDNLLECSAAFGSIRPPSLETVFVLLLESLPRLPGENYSLTRRREVSLTILS